MYVYECMYCIVVVPVCTYVYVQFGSDKNSCVRTYVRMCILLDCDHPCNGPRAASIYSSGRREKGAPPLSDLGSQVCHSHGKREPQSVRAALSSDPQQRIWGRLLRWGHPNLTYCWGFIKQAKIQIYTQVFWRDLNRRRNLYLPLQEKSSQFFYKLVSFEKAILPLLLKHAFLLILCFYDPLFRIFTTTNKSSEENTFMRNQLPYYY